MVHPGTTYSKIEHICASQPDNSVGIDEEKQAIEGIRELHITDFCRRCDYCLPCTEDISIQIVLGFRSIVKRMGTQILKDSWQRDAVEDARKCSEGGECIKRCPYQLPIPDLIKENIQWIYDKLKKNLIRRL